MIYELTPEQEARLPSFVDEWMKIGTCTDPADRPAAEAAISKMYIADGEAVPEFMWADSPLAAATLFDAVRHLSSASSRRGTCKKTAAKSLNSPRRASLRRSLDIMRGKLCVVSGGALSALLWSSLYTAVRWRLSTSIQFSLVDSLDMELAQLLLNLRVGLPSREITNVEYQGQHEVYWIAHSVFIGDVVGGYPDELAERLGWWADIAKSCCWWWPYKGVCIISDRPEVCRLENGVIHADDGPCVRFRDGWSLWAIRGVVVDEQVVMRPETQTLAQIRADDNLERKRIRIERYGWARYLDEVGAEVLDERNNDIEASREALLRSSDGELVLVARCPSTHKVFHMEVLDPAVTTCEQAQTWLHGGLNHYFTGRA